jgi:phosphodiesterase/alkaline phosphatase D-like protein
VTSSTLTFEGGEGTSPVNHVVNLSGLEASAKYFYRFAATNSIGTTKGAIKSFTQEEGEVPAVKPAVSTTGPGKVGNRTVPVEGTVDAEALSTTYWVDYGLTESVTSKTSELSAGSGTEPIAYIVELKSLEPKTKYFFRFSAKNSAGTTNGAIKSFITEPDPPPQLLKPKAGSDKWTAVGVTHAWEGLGDVSAATGAKKGKK